MLGYLDTLIGFAVVMLVISLLITILTQIVSGLINHRGSNLKWGLKTLFANIDPKQFPNLTANADRVAEAVLTHCLVSDSWFSGNKVAQQIGKFPPLGKLFRRFQLATAIRPAELTAILKHLSSNTYADDRKEIAAEIQKLLGVADAVSASAAAVGRPAAAAPIVDVERAVKDAAAKADDSADQAAGLVQFDDGPGVAKIHHVHAHLDGRVCVLLCVRTGTEHNEPDRRPVQQQHA